MRSLPLNIECVNANGTRIIPCVGINGISISHVETGWNLGSVSPASSQVAAKSRKEPKSFDNIAVFVIAARTDNNKKIIEEYRGQD